MSEIPVLSFHQYAALHGLTTDEDVYMHIQAGLRSAPQTKTHKRWYEGKTLKLQDARDASKAAYAEALRQGTVLPPPPTTLEEKAKGHPDNPSVQAAIRLLAKRAARAAAPSA
jgi:hypothetical protein